MMTSILLVLLSLLVPAAVLSADTATVQLTPTSMVSPPIPPNLVSFSIEVYDFVRWTDWYPNPTRPAWLNLMNQLILTPGQEGPRYRIGGNSGDLTVYDISPLPKLPSGEPIIHSLNSTELQSWKQALAHINSKAVLDLNFRRGDNASWAVSYVEAIDKYIGWDMTVAMEVGNEIDLYASNGIRAKDYNYTQYKKEWLYYTDEIAKAVPAAPKRIFQGLVEIYFNWLGSELQDYLAVAQDRLFSISQHSYPVPSCDGEDVTIAEVMNDQYAESTSQFLTQHNTIATLDKAGVEFVVGEGSEAVCNGRGPSVLNVFGTALWAIHQLFEVAAVGVKHWYFHSWGTQTATFSVLVYGNPSAPNTFLVQPIYYGLRLFNMATSHNATMIKTAVTSSNPHVHAFATINSQNVISIAAVHKDLNATSNCTLTISMPLPSNMAAPPDAEVIRLIAPSAMSEYGVSLGGQTYDGSADGMPIGTMAVELVTGTQTQGGVSYEVHLPAVSAFLMRVKLPSQAARHFAQPKVQVE